MARTPLRLGLAAALSLALGRAQAGELPTEAFPIAYEDFRSELVFPKILRPPTTLVTYNREALRVLGLSESVPDSAPRPNESPSNETLLSRVQSLVPTTGKGGDTLRARAADYVREQMQSPMRDPENLAERQATWEALNRSPEQLERLVTVKLSLDALESLPSAAGRAGVGAKLEQATRLVRLVEDIQSLGAPREVVLQRLTEFGARNAKDPKFQLLSRFVHEVAEPYQLADTLERLERILKGPPNQLVEDLVAREEFFATAQRLAQAAASNTLRALMPPEPAAVGHVDAAAQLQALLTRFRAHALTHVGSAQDAELSRQLTQDFKGYEEVVNYYASAFALILRGALPTHIKAGTLGDELGYLIAVARLNREWQHAGATLVTPTLLPREARRVSFPGVVNPLLLLRSKGSEVIPNDVPLFPGHTAIGLSGSNQSGKSTLMRGKGVLSWASFLGWLSPSMTGEKVEVSSLERIATLFGASDSISKGVSHFKAELQRADEELERVSPYSLLLVDQFADGTGETPAAKATLWLLEVASKRGAMVIAGGHKVEVFKALQKDQRQQPKASQARPKARRFPDSAVYGMKLDVDANSKQPTWTREAVRDHIARSEGDISMRQVGFQRDALLERSRAIAQARGEAWPFDASAPSATSRPRRARR